MPDLDLNEISALIRERKKSFAAYNIIRLRELLRYLPRKKSELFQLIPFLLHVNTPDFPGYVPSSEPFYGIYDFLATGFWRHVRSRFKIKPHELSAYISRKNSILGLYLMGSSGTLAQAAHSDFDYWVLVDDSLAEPRHTELLNRKLAQISRWSQEAYQQHVTFFTLPHSQIKANAFSGVDEESSGSLQMTILKEEFYRTFILIAGKIPWWAVMPAGCDDLKYNHLIELAAASQTSDFTVEDYVDLGNMTAVDTAECLPAVLWQVYKSRNDAVKALLKASLIAWFYFFGQEEPLPCDQARTNFSERRLDSHLFDPYSLVLDKAETFYHQINDEEGVDLIRRCIFFRLSGYPQLLRAAAGPKGRLMQRYLARWQWSAEKVNALNSYPAWPETQKLAFEKELLDKISFLYEMILRSQDTLPAGLPASLEDLAALKNRIRAAFHPFPGKIPAASAFVRSRAKAEPFVLACQIDETHQFEWQVVDPVLQGKERDERQLFTGPELLRAVGWLLANGLGGGDLSQVVAIPNHFPGSATRLARILAAASRFFTCGAPGPAAMARKPLWERMFLLAEPASPAESSLFHTVTFLTRNTWGEFYFSRMNLSGIENPAIRCYRIASFIWEFMQITPALALAYQVHSFRPDADREIHRLIDDYVAGFKSGAAGAPSMVSDSPAPAVQEPADDMKEDDDKPFLDLL